MVKGYIFYLPTKRTKILVPASIVRKIVTTELCPLPHYMFSKYLSRDEVLAFLKGARGAWLMRKVARYILFYAENIVLTTFLMLIEIEGRRRTEKAVKAKKYVDHHIKLLEALRRIASKEKISREDVERMIELCLKHGIDPF